MSHAGERRFYFSKDKKGERLKIIHAHFFYIGHCGEQFKIDFKVD
jgi:hypothetical protein